MNTKAALWTGRVLSGLVILFLTVDGAIKLVPIQPVTDSLRELGYPTSDSFARFLGVVTLVGTALYAWPRTSLLGAVLLTGLMGGAIASPSAARPSAVQPHAVRRLSRPVPVGRTVAARRASAPAHAVQPTSDVICSASWFC